MDLTQARELYSGYYEGTIERRSAVALEEAMQSNPEIASDYQLFASVMDALPALAEESVEMPADLHDRIMQKVDHYEWERKQEKKFSLFAAPKLAWYGVAAAVFIGFAALAVIQAAKSNGVSEASTGISAQTPFDVSFVVENGQVTLTAVGPNNSSVVLTSPDAGVQPQTHSTSSGVVKVPMQNMSEEPRVIEVTAMVGKAKHDSYVMVLPGSSRSAVLTGKGTVVDCAKAVANTFGTPVQVEGDPSKACSWTMNSKDTAGNLVVALGRTKIDARVATSGLLQISVR